jgi:hypothetical protein
MLRFTKFVLAILLLVSSLNVSFIGYKAKAASDIESAEYIDQHLMIPDGTKIYRADGYYGSFDVRLVKVYLFQSVGGETFIYNMVNPALNANNGYLIIAATDVEKYISYFGQYSSPAYVEQVKSVLDAKGVGITLKDDFGAEYHFYSYAELAQMAGGAPGSITRIDRGTTPTTYRLEINNTITYDKTKHHMSIDMPSQATVNTPVEITFNTTDASYFISS